jgi:hypothetical protein
LGMGPIHLEVDTGVSISTRSNFVSITTSPNYSLLTPSLTVALFIGSIRNDPNSQQIWDFNSNDFCGWVNYYLNQGYGGGASVRLDRVLPS